jgi:hypothetical protein
MHRLILIFTLVFSSTKLFAAPFPLKDFPHLDALELSEWQFKWTPSGQEDEIDWSTEDFAAERNTWPSVTFPHPWPRNTKRVGWYRCVVTVPETWSGDAELCILAAKFTTDVFVNGDYVSIHRGGYSPFRIPLKTSDQETRSFEVLLRVDTRLSDETVPKPNVGWGLFGGIDREAYLLHLSPVRPEKLQIITRMNPNGGWQLRFQADTLGSSPKPLRLRLENGGKLIAKASTPWAEHLDITLDLKNPELWSTENPVLHDLTLEYDGHSFTLPVGIREITWTPKQLLLNGKPLWLQGFGQHETGWGESATLTYVERKQDLLLMKDLFRANTLRAGHYPNHPDVYNLADEIGMLVFTEIPVWQNRGDLLASEQMWELWLEPQLRGMTETLRNHPSVFAWGLLNETSAQAYVIRAKTLLDTLDPSRKSAAVLDKTRWMNASAHTDFLARNLHYGWYHSKSVYALTQGLNINLNAANDKPLWISEFGGLARRGHAGAGFSDDVRGSETYLEKMIRFGLQTALARSEEIVGISIWTWTDFRRGRGWTHHGILDNNRQPKLAAYAALNLMRPDEVVLARESARVLPPGTPFTAEISVHSKSPQPDAKRKVLWQIRSGSTEIKEGTFSQPLSASSVTSFPEVTWEVPADQQPALYHLYLELRDENDTLLHTQAIALEAGETAKPAILRLAPPPENKTQWVEVNGMKLRCYPHIGLLIALAPGEQQLSFSDQDLTLPIAPGEIKDVPWP